MPVTRRRTVLRKNPSSFVGERIRDAIRYSSWGDIVERQPRCFPD